MTALFEIIFDLIYGLNGGACLLLFAGGVVVTVWLINASPTVPVDTPEDNRVA